MDDTRTCSAMADGGEAVVVVFGTEAEDDLRLLLCSLLLLGTLSISWDNCEDETDAADDLVLAVSTGVILAGESLEFIPTELLTNRTSIIMGKKPHVYTVDKVDQRILRPANFFVHADESSSCVKCHG